MKRTALVPQCARALTAVFAFILSAGIFTPQAGAGEANVYLAVDSYTWKEFDDNGDRLLKESGTLMGLGFDYYTERENHVTLRPLAEIFGGEVDYDGHTQTGIPATTKVSYFGLKLQGDVGRSFRPAPSFTIEPFGGLGLRAWVRDLHDGTTSTGLTTSGYTEDWFTLHARIGVRGGIDVSSGTTLFVEAGVKAPLYNENTAYLNSGGVGSVTMNPGKQVSLFAETGVKLDRFKASLFLPRASLLSVLIPCRATFSRNPLPISTASRRAWCFSPAPGASRRP